MRRTVIRNWGGAGVAAVTLATILFATLTPTPGTPTMSFWCIVCGERGLLDFSANVVMFVPLGFAFMLATDRRWGSFLACLATTLGIELLQIRVVAGRDASLGDLLANTLGGGIGVALAHWRAVFLFPRPAAARGLTLAWAALFAVACGLASAGLHPASVPRSLWIQWTPPRRGFEPFTGQLLAFDVNGINLPVGWPETSLGVDRVLRGPAWRATATIAADRLESRRSVIVRIAEEYGVLVSIEQAGLHVTCMQKTRAGDFGFRSPKVALENALPLGNGEAPSMVTVRCIRDSGTLIAGVDERRETLRLSPGLGWFLVSPLDIALTRALWWANALWLIGLTIPLGYWVAVATWADTARRRGRAMLVLALASSLAVGLMLAPIGAGTAIAAIWEWGAALCGLALGSVLSRLTRHREVRRVSS